MANFSTIFSACRIKLLLIAAFNKHFAWKHLLFALTLRQNPQPVKMFIKISANFQKLNKAYA
jgi:hypothetical protein